MRFKLSSREIFGLSNVRASSNSFNCNRALRAKRYSSLPFTPLNDDHQASSNRLVNVCSTDSLPKSQVLTLSTIRKLYEDKVPITMLTAHDFSTARMVGMSASSSISNNQAESSLTDRHLAGIDICLVGDSLAMVSLGYSSTTELGFDEFSSHVQAVRRGLDSLKHEKFHRIPILVADLPFGSYEASLEQGVRSAIELSKRARVDGFKIEGGPEIVPLIRRLTSFGMSVFGHIGLTPQRASSLGGFKVQGHDSSSKARQIISDALLLQDSGCVALVLEAIPTEVVHQITTRLSIPTIGIGAGPSTDGQVLVLNDLIGALDSETPKFVPKFEVPRNSNKMSLSSAKASWKLGMDIVNEYVYQVRTRQFPVMGQHTYKMKPQVLKELDEKGWI